MRVAPPTTFEPHLDSNVLASQLLVLAVTCGGALYWWLEVVPNARRRLAKEKRQGDVREMLEEIQQRPDNRRLERWFYSDWLKQLERRQELAQRAAQKRASAGDEVFSNTPTATQTASASGRESEDQSPAAHAAAARQEGVPDNYSDVQHAVEKQDPASSAQSGRGQPAEGIDEDDKMPNFWSLDNPLIAVGALLCIAVIRTVVFHQGSS